MKRTIAIVAGIACATLAGCSVADPDTSQVVLHYSGGAFSNQSFKECIPPGVRSVNSVNENYYYYPHGTRVYTFRGGAGQPVAGAQEGAIWVNTKNNVQMAVEGSITFRLREECAPYTDKQGVHWPGGIFQKFHDTIGKSHAMFATDGGQPMPVGWDEGLNLFLGGPASKALNNAGLGYNWQDLYSNLQLRNEFVANAEKDIVALVSQQAGDDFFEILNVQVDQPQPPGNLTDQLNQYQAQQLQNQQAKQAQDLAASFPGGLTGYQDFQQRSAVIDAIKNGRVNPLLIPQGSAVIVGGH